MKPANTLVEPLPDIDDLDRAIIKLSARMNAANYELLVLIRRFDERAGWLKWGFSNCVDWLHWRCDLSIGAAREKVRVAHGLKSLPAIAAAFASGKLSYSKVRALVRVARCDNEDTLLAFALKTTKRTVAIADFDDTIWEHSMKRTMLISTLLLAFSACGDSQQSDPARTAGSVSADTVYTNGKIYTVNESRPWVEALAVKDGKFLAVGSNEDIDLLTGTATKVIDLSGKFVMPGIVDLHHHGIDVSTTAVNSDALTLTEEQRVTPEAIAAAVREFAQSRPDLPIIYAEDFPDGMFEGNNGPKEMLDEAEAERPVIILSSGGHAHWANSTALEQAGITADTPDPEYGVIGRKPGSNEPIGGVHESAMQLLLALREFPTPELVEAGLQQHVKRINSLGITAVRIAGMNQVQLEAAVAADKAGKLNAYHSLAFNWRTSYINQREGDFDLVREQILTSRDVSTQNVAGGVLKYYADGAPASKTAYLLEDYIDDPGNRSQFQMDEDLFREEMAFWTENGITAMTHVTGDAGARSFIDAIEAAQEQHGQNGVRHHMTHSVMVHPDDIARIPRLGMVVDVSPCVAAPMQFHNAYKHFFGEDRHETFFPSRALIDAGADFAVASDFPVGPDNPWSNIEVWTTRMNPQGEMPGTLGGHSAITLEEAIKGATLVGAYGLYMEDEFGSLEEGKRATFIVLDRNPFEILAADLSETQVLQTYFNGRLVFDAGSR